MLQYTIAVEGMACSMCEAHVNDAVRKAFPIKKVTSSHSKGQTQILCENRLDEDALRSAISAEQAAIFRLEGAPPSEEFPFIQESEALEILFCRKGGLILEWAGHRRLSLSADQVLFLPVRTEAYRGQFASESFYGTLVRMEAKAAWSALRAMHSDLGESISRAWNDPCMLKAALWSEALFSALDYMQPGHIGDYYVIKALEVLFLLHAQREGLALPPQCDYHTHSQIETIREIQKYLVGHLDERLTIQMLSQQFRISGTALKSCFRQVYGVPIHQYLLEQAALPYASLPISTECK